MNRCKLIGVSQDSKRLHKDTNSDIRCVVPLRKESIRSYLLILFSKSKSNNTNEFSASLLSNYLIILLSKRDPTLI